MLPLKYYTIKFMAVREVTKVRYPFHTISKKILYYLRITQYFTLFINTSTPRHL